MWTPRKILYTFVGAIVLTVMFPVLAVPMSTPVLGVEVIADDELDQYSGSGSLILPSAISASSRQRAASCVGCRWKVTLPCRRDDDHQDAGCRGVILGCPQGREVKRAWVAAPGRDYEPVGLFCPTDGEAVSVEEATSAIRGTFRHRIPALRPICEPPRGVVVGIPVHCRSGQPTAEVAWSDQVVGYSVRTRARARWTWVFDAKRGEPVSVAAVIPGEAYPRPGVQHVFGVAGPSRVAVMATWDGEFFVDGLGPFPITPELTQQVEFNLPVGSALGVIRP